jgi:hypothetical protein
MGLIALLLMLAGFIGCVLSYFGIAIHAFKEQGPVWGLVCLLTFGGNLIWGAVHWSDDEARPIFIRYLACIGMLFVGMVLHKHFNTE